MKRIFVDIKEYDDIVKLAFYINLQFSNSVGVQKLHTDLIINPG